MTIREKVFGHEHPDVAESYSDIGGLYYYNDKYSEALDYLGKALTIYEKVFDKNHPASKFISDTILEIKQKQALSK